MKVARVVGNIVATRKEPKLEGLKLLLVEQLKVDGQRTGTFLVAADTVGVGIDETVLLVSGSSARMSLPKDGTPIDAAVVGVIDAIRWNDKDYKPLEDFE